MDIIKIGEKSPIFITIKFLFFVGNYISKVPANIICIQSFQKVTQTNRTTKTFFFISLMPK